MLEPFSDNIIFFDTEFSSLDPRVGEILSIGIVKLDGKELYLELEYSGKCSDWVKKNILPNLKQKKLSAKKAISEIKKFLGEGSRPYAVSYVNQFDMAYLYKLTPQDESPFYWLPIDIASILFGFGIDPEIMARDNDSLYKKLKINHSKYKKHNALEDAKLLREVYLKLLK